MITLQDIGYLIVFFMYIALFMAVFGPVAGIIIYLALRVCIP